MLVLTKFLTAMILPPFNSLILWLFSLIFRWLNYRKLSRICTLLGFGLLYLFSTPIVSQKLVQGVSLTQNFTLADYRQAQAIVVLGGGVRESLELFDRYAVAPTPLERLRYGAFLHKETALPLLLTGGSPEDRVPEAEQMAKELKMFFNLSPQWVETRSNTTKENAIYSAEILQPLGIKKIVVVTNQWHLKRAKMLFEKQGFEVLGAAVGSQTALEFGGLAFIPQALALQNSSTALKEWLGYWKERLLG